MDRALRIVLWLQQGRTLSVSEAAAELMVAESTAYRLLSTLVGRGFATQDNTRRYGAGPAISPVPKRPVPHQQLIDASAPVLEAISEKSQETAHLMVRTGVMVSYLAGRYSNRLALRIGLRTGQQMPAYCTAGGRAMLAELTNEQVEEIHQNGLPPWPTARIGSMTALRRRLGMVRRDGYGTSFHETEHGVVSAGVAVKRGSEAVCALVLAAPSIRYRRADLPIFVAALAEGAQQLSNELEKAPESL